MTNYQLTKTNAIQNEAGETLRGAAISMLVRETDDLRNVSLRTYGSIDSVYADAKHVRSQESDDRIITVNFKSFDFTQREVTAILNNVAQLPAQENRFCELASAYLQSAHEVAERILRSFA